jgi:hypothetical protein
MSYLKRRFVSLFLLFRGLSQKIKGLVVKEQLPVAFSGSEEYF